MGELLWSENVVTYKIIVLFDLLIRTAIFLAVLWAIMIRGMGAFLGIVFSFLLLLFVFSFFNPLLLLFKKPVRVYTNGIDLGNFHVNSFPTHNALMGVGFKWKGKWKELFYQLFGNNSRLSVASYLKGETLFVSFDDLSELDYRRRPTGSNKGTVDAFGALSNKPSSWRLFFAGFNLFLKVRSGKKTTYALLFMVPNNFEKFVNSSPQITSLVK